MAVKSEHSFIDFIADSQKKEKNFKGEKEIYNIHEKIKNFL